MGVGEGGDPPRCARLFRERPRARRALSPDRQGAGRASPPPRERKPPPAAVRALRHRRADRPRSPTRAAPAGRPPGGARLQTKVGQRGDRPSARSPTAVLLRRAVSGRRPARRGTSDARSLDDLIRPQQQRLRNREAEGFGGLQINDELEFRWLLDRDFVRLRPAQNLVDKVSGAAPQVRKGGPIGRQASLFGVLPVVTNGRKSRPHRQIVDQSPIGEEQWIGRDKKSVCSALERLDGRRYVLKSPNFEGDRPQI